jgi:hypothetical protein
MADATVVGSTRVSVIPDVSSSATGCAWSCPPLSASPPKRLVTSPET